MCMKEDNHGMKNIKGANSRELNVWAGRYFNDGLAHSSSSSHHPFIAGVSKNNIDMEIVLVMIITTLLKHNHLLLLMPTLLQNYI